ncbi:MAG: hypothetical protein JWP14_405 [Frankiales bacterium]|jgi:hypothetical protein|nr:hypothetical protein [Frankiales bacterium]
MTLSKIAVRMQARALAGDRQRGDIPGWVLITIMTAGLVTLVWGVASDQLSSILKSALNSVKSP